MKRPVKRRLIVPAVVVAALAGGAVAVAANSSSSPSRREVYLDSVAGHLGVSPEKLTAAMRAAASEQIQAAVASGRLSKQQGEALEQRLKEGHGPLFGGSFAGHGAGTRQALITAAASYLGVSPQTLRSERREGKSLAQIAASTPGKSAAGLKAVLVAAAEKQIDAAVASGRLSSTRAQTRKAHLPQLVEMLMQRSGHGPGPGALGAHRHRSGASLGSQSATGAVS